MKGDLTKSHVSHCHRRMARRLISTVNNTYDMIDHILLHISSYHVEKGVKKVITVY